MNLTLREVKERLATLDEVTLIEELNIRSEDIVERFEDVIEADLERIKQLIEWEDTDG